MSNDALIVDLLDLRKEMRGISPKLSIYAKMQEREADLVKRIGHDPEKGIVKKLKKLKHVRAIADRNAKRVLNPKRCSIPGCTKLGRSMGAAKSDGHTKRSNKCNEHYKKKKQLV